jgi:hypothetical protein
MKAVPMIFMFCLGAVPVLSQGLVLKGFSAVGEGFTSLTRNVGIDIAFRMFSTPTFPKVCAESERPFKLTAPNGTVALHVGNWYSLRGLIVVGEDRRGNVLRPLPISVEVETKDPELLNLRSDMISDGRIMPLRTGAFRFRARTLCDGTSSDVYIEAVVRKR